jgi:hypothetical protein
MLVEAKAHYGGVIAGSSNEYLIQPVYMVAITAHIQVIVKGMTDHSAFSTGCAKALRCAPGSDRLPYYVGLAAQEELTIALITDKVTECAGEGDEGILFSHKRLF